MRCEIKSLSKTFYQKILAWSKAKVSNSKKLDINKKHRKNCMGGTFSFKNILFGSISFILFHLGTFSLQIISRWCNLSTSS